MRLCPNCISKSYFLKNLIYFGSFKRFVYNEYSDEKQSILVYTICVIRLANMAILMHIRGVRAVGSSNAPLAALLTYDRHRCRCVPGALSAKSDIPLDESAEQT